MVLPPMRKKKKKTFLSLNFIANIIFLLYELLYRLTSTPKSIVIPNPKPYLVKKKYALANF